MLKFDPDSLTEVAAQIRTAFVQLDNARRLYAGPFHYTGSPAVRAAFVEHGRFMVGQTGSFEAVQIKLSRNLGWLLKNFTIHRDVLVKQEQLNVDAMEMLHQRGLSAGGAMGLARMLAMRDISGFDNVIYAEPAAVVEATMPLQALIAAFTTDDVGPLALSKGWQAAATKLTSAMDALEGAGRLLSASTEGTSFDMAREAMDAVVRTGRIVAGNAEVMAVSVAQFPVIRAQNLAALQAIQASTAGIAEPAARLAAEQAAVATFVSTRLQPSLEVVRPPLTNLGVPIVGHTGGGMLDAYSQGRSSGAVGVDPIAGLAATGGGVAGGVASAGEDVVGAVGRGDAAAVTPSGVTDAVAHSPVASAGAGGASPHGMGTGGGTHPSGVPGVGTTASGVPGASGARNVLGLASGGAGRDGAGVGGAGRDGAGRDGAGVAGVGGVGRDGAGRPGAGRPGLPPQALRAALEQARQYRLGAGPQPGTGTGTGAGAATGGGAEGRRSGRGLFGWFGAGGTGSGGHGGAGHPGGMNVGPHAGFGSGSGSGSGAGSNIGSTSGSSSGSGRGAGAFPVGGAAGAGGSRGGSKGKGKKFNFFTGKEDREYFSRLFMGERPRTVRSTIDRS